MNNRIAALVASLTAVLTPVSPAGEAGEISREFIYESAPFPSCHASTIVETAAGGLVTAWFGGSDEGEPDVGIWLSRQENGSWTPPQCVSLETGGKPEPHWNPVLFQPRGAPLVLFYKAGPTPQTWRGVFRTSEDGGKTWQPEQALPMLGPIKNKPVELADGTVICPSSRETDSKPSQWRLAFEVSRPPWDKWTLVEPSSPGNPVMDAIQPSLLQHADGRLLAIGRSRQGRLFEVWSDDQGKSWGPVTAGTLPNPSSGTDAVTLRDGRHLVVYNHTAKGRSPLNVAISTDGRIWQAAAVLESEPGEYSYPAVIQSADGRVHLTWTWKRQRIRHVVLDPDKLVLRPIVDGKWPE